MKERPGRGVTKNDGGVGGRSGELQEQMGDLAGGRQLPRAVAGQIHCCKKIALFDKLFVILSAPEMWRLYVDCLGEV